MKKNKQDIINKNSKGRFHGYQQWYVGDKIYLRGVCKKSRYIGYLEAHDSKVTIFRI